MNEQSSVMGGLFDLDRLEEDIAAHGCRCLNHRPLGMIAKSFNQVIQKNNELKAIYDTFHKMEFMHEETGLLFEMYKEEPDEEVVKSLTQ